MDFAYEIAGEGLKTGKNRAYSTEVKLDAVNLYLTSNWSARDIAKDLGIIDYSRILDWVRRYRSDNFEAFKQSRGRPKTGQEIINKKTELSLDEKDFRIRELERELENTKIELKYLKGLRRLRMEQQAKEKHVLFKPSTENSSSQSNNC